MKKLLILAMFSVFFTGSVAFANELYDCFRCDGRGRISVSRTIRCPSCSGIKRVCSDCKGRGRIFRKGPGESYWKLPDTDELCIGCFGTGKAPCDTCFNSGTKTLIGHKTCPLCKGHGKIIIKSK